MNDTATISHSPADVRATREWSAFYRFKGFNPLPSRADEKRPFLRWSQWTDRVVPPDLFDRFATANLQIMTGRRWGLLIVDLDGPEAIEHWPTMGPHCPRTWMTHSGGHGRHLWFSIPLEGEPIPSGRVWGVWEPEARDGKGDWAKRKAIEILGERKLVMAPPSIHPKTGRKYKFIAGHTPREIPRPAPAPGWVLRLPIVRAPKPLAIVRPPVATRPTRLSGGRFDRSDVLSAIPDKASLAASWGLRIASRSPNGAGWMECHAIDRDDRHPSAGFHPESGRYWEPDSGSISFFDLAVRLNVYADWRDAINGLGQTHALHLKRA